MLKIRGPHARGIDNQFALGKLDSAMLVKLNGSDAYGNSATARQNAFLSIFRPGTLNPRAYRCCLGGPLERGRFIPSKKLVMGVSNPRHPFLSNISQSVIYRNIGCRSRSGKSELSPRRIT